MFWRKKRKKKEFEIPNPKPVDSRLYEIIDRIRDCEGSVIVISSDGKAEWSVDLRLRKDAPEMVISAILAAAQQVMAAAGVDSKQAEWTDYTDEQ